MRKWVSGVLAGFAAGVLAHGAAWGQSTSMFPQNSPTSNKVSLSYKVNFFLTSDTSSSSSGDSSSFSVKQDIKVSTIETDNRPLIISDSVATRGGSSNTTAEINNFFPKSTETDAAASVNTDALEKKFKDLSKVAITLEVIPKALSEEDKQKIVLSSNFTAIASTTLTAASESDSPNFVSSFQNQLLDKKFLTR